jgi:hypothetical protein
VGGEYYANPVAVGDHILLCAERGDIFLIKTGDTLEIAYRTDLGEPIFATPAVVDNTLYLRSNSSGPRLPQMKETHKHALR